MVSPGVISDPGALLMLFCVRVNGSEKKKFFSTKYCKRFFIPPGLYIQAPKTAADFSRLQRDPLRKIVNLGCFRVFFVLLSFFCITLYNFARGGVLCFRRVFYRLSVVSRRGGACVASFGGFLRSLVPFAVPGWLLHRFRDPLHVRQLFRLCGFACCPFWLHIWPAVGFCSVSGAFFIWSAFRRSVAFSCVRFDLWQRFRLLGLVCPFEFRQLWPAFGRGCSVHLWPGSLPVFGYNLPVVFSASFWDPGSVFFFYGSMIARRRCCSGCRSPRGLL